jgi:Mrp family chromosome partitioning ATPase
MSTAIVLATPRVTPPPPVPPVPQAFWCNLDPRLVVLAEPDSARAAAFRVLRDNVLAKGMPRVLAVSSATPHEGKTTCAANLAFALAEHPTPKRLLLLDANFFAPTLAGMFSIDEYAPAYAPSPFRLTALSPRLDLATLVLTRGEPLPRLERESLALLVGALLNRGYDHVVVDMPALEKCTATAQLLDVPGGVLLAARAGRSTKGALRRAAAKVPSSKLLGVALVDDPLA